MSVDMKSPGRGKSTSSVELLNVSPHGLWLGLDGAEHFLPFTTFPFLESATIAQLAKVQRPTAQHLWWPDLDVDLHVDSLVDPERFPLLSRNTARKSGARRRTAAPRANP